MSGRGSRHPWLTLEKVAIRQWVNEKRAPFLGVCLGHQLLADALGGKVGLMSVPEIGVLEVELTDAGRSAPLFEGMPAAFRCSVAQRRSLGASTPCSEAR